jgi:hypothetical protein
VIATLRKLVIEVTVTSFTLAAWAQPEPVIRVTVDSRNPMFAMVRKHYPPGDVYKYAEQTGGQVMKSGKEEVAAKLADLIDQIRTRYSLGYRASADQPAGKFCEIKLNVSRDVVMREGQVVVKAKRGYYRRASSGG